MLHPHTRLAWISDVIGVGVVATQPIPKGTIVWARDPLDVILSRERVRELGALYEPAFFRYAYDDGNDRLVLCWDHARFVNHACEATCLGGSFEFEVAVRDVAVGEQITDDYATLFLTEPMTCACGSPRCRGEVRPDDPTRLADTWDAAFADALHHAPDVPQPLWCMLNPREAAEITARALPPARRHSRPAA